MKKLIFGLAAIATLGISIAYADPYEDREAIMKERGRTVGALSKMAKGETPFDAAAALEQLKVLQANGEKTDVAALWPEGSGGGESESSPKIWEDMAGFTAAEEKFEAAVTAAVAAAPADVTALQASVGEIGKSCGGCHETYRIKKN